MSSPIDVSVVIGFKDWGVERLLVSVQSILRSFGPLTGEVIVSDYGSQQPSSLKDSIEALGARYVYTPTNGVWSRSRALNAGFAHSSGKVLISTDADMLFTPDSMGVIGERVISNPNEAVVLQCRDLPEKFHAAALDPMNLQWQEYADSATLRPRWGMGGMMAVSRNTFLSLRGFDERMEIYGGEDMDFAQRVRWSGVRLTWLEDPRVRMYHIWHPSSRQEVSQTPEGLAAIKFNRDIFLNDKSIVRNTKTWLHRPDDAPPLASVVISTRDRGNYIAESIYSVLNQSVSDIELLIIDDGSTDDTEAVVLGIEDNRIRYFKRTPAGIAAARNYAASVSRGAYTVIHDDDDIMFPDRIENHFQALEGGVSGTYGGWIDFQNSDASDCTANPGKEFSLPALLFSSKVYAHATLMLRTQLIRDIGYDERLRSGSDYNLALRLARSGVRLTHTGHFHLIRRLHDRQVTAADSAVQKGSARVSSTLALRSLRPGKQKVLRESTRDLATIAIKGAGEPYSLIYPYLPDHLTKRTLRISSENMESLPNTLSCEPRFSHIRVTDNRTGDIITSFGELVDASWEDMARLTSSGVPFDVSISRPQEGQKEVSLRRGQLLRRCVDSYLEQLAGSSAQGLPGLLVLSGPSGSLPIMSKQPLADVTVSTGDDLSIQANAYSYTSTELARDIRGCISRLPEAVNARYVANDINPDGIMRQIGTAKA